MNESEQLLPILIVVTGRVASGKTTLAHTLARQIRCPVISRDEIKEGLINTTKNIEQNQAKWHVYDTFFEIIELLLNKNITLIAEAAFQHKLWMPKLELLKDIAEIRIVCCCINLESAKSRFTQRNLSDPQRAYFHGEKTVQTAKIKRLIDDYNPPAIDVPTLTVDTSDGYEPNIEAIVSFVRSPK